MILLKDCLRGEKDQAFRRVRLTTVDNFQGEENDIILLSLVRSNKNEKVGFIKIENRACVALSRAKKGFYCVGNLTLLSKHSDIWRKIVEDLKARGSIVNALPLKCQIHRSEVFVKRAKDFKDKVPHGGCLRPCKVRLQCGHSCKKRCHPYDVEHEQYRCGEPCHRTIKGCTHSCRKLCCEECDTYCTVIVQKMLPSCGHVADVCCGKDADRVECKRPCEKDLPCSHRCQEKCGKPCTRRCQELVKRSDWPCKHEVTVACSATPANCPVPCGSTIACGHPCSGTCGECRMGRVHKRCKLKCGRCWFVLTRAGRPASCLALHVPDPVKTVVCTVNANQKNVANPAFHVLSFVLGNVAIISVPSCVESCAADKDATNRALKPSHAEAVVMAMFVVVCAENHAYVLFDTPMMVVE